MTPGQAWRRVWELAWPIVLANLSVPLVGLVDTAVLGHLPDPAALGGVALAGVVFSFLYWGFGFLRMGTTGLAAQARGRALAAPEGGEPPGVFVRALLLRGLATAAALGAALILLREPIGWLAWRLLEADAPVQAAAELYYRIRIQSAPATLANYVLLGLLLGLQHRHAPLVLLLTLNLGNALLDVALVWGLGWGVAGAAWASLWAEYATLLLGLALVLRRFRHEAWLRTPWPSPAHLLEPAALKGLWAVNRDLFLRTLLLIFALGFFTAQGARFGPVILAANAVLLNFQTLLAYALDGIAHALEALVGEARGGGDPARLRAVVRAGALGSGAFGLAFTVAYFLAGEALVDLLTDQDAVRQAARDYLPWVIASPLVAVWSYLLDGMFIGATRTREMRDAMAVAVLGVYLPVWYLTRPWDNHGLWFSLLVFLAARALLLGWLWRRH